jgi:hypothetical protein
MQEVCCSCRRNRDTNGLISARSSPPWNLGGFSALQTQQAGASWNIFGTRRREWRGTSAVCFLLEKRAWELPYLR